MVTNRLWSLVNGDRAIPPKPETGADGVVVTDVERKARDIVANKYDEYMEDRSRAASILLESMVDDHRHCDRSSANLKEEDSNICSTIPDGKKCSKTQL